MATVMRCAVVVEIAGRPLKGEKSAKVLGLEISESSAVVRVLGYKRELRVAARDVQQLVDGRVAEGRLAVVCKDGMKLMLSQAQPTQLAQVVRLLRGGSSGTGLALGAPDASPAKPVACAGGAGSARPVARPAKLRRTEAAAAAAAAPPPAAAPVAHECDENALQARALHQLLDLGSWGFSLDQLAESCRSFDVLILTQRQKLRLGPATARAGVPPELVVRRIERQPHLVPLCSLDLSGFASLTAGAAGQLANALLNGPGRSVLELRLRSCKALSDTSVRRLVSACPSLEVLDLLDIPRLGDQALADVPLHALRMLVAGRVSRLPVAEGLRGRSRGNGLSAPMVLGAVAAAPQSLQQKQAQWPALYTPTLLARLVRGQPQQAALPGGVDAGGVTAGGVPAGGAPAGAATRGGVPAGGARAGGAPSNGGAPLTHLVLAHCADIQVLPRLPATLRHLDLRGAGLQMSTAAAKGWRPLEACQHLEALCLAGNLQLSEFATLMCVASLPGAARLRALDLSSTLSGAEVFDALLKLPPLQALTHLGLAHTSLRNEELVTLVAKLLQLQVLDVAGCSQLEAPISILLEAAERVAANAATVAGTAAGIPAGTLAGAAAAAVRRVDPTAPELAAAAALPPPRRGFPSARVEPVSTEQPAAAATEHTAAAAFALRRFRVPEAALPNVAGDVTVGEENQGPLAALRIMGVGQTDFALYLDVTRRAVASRVPTALVLASSLQLFGDYSVLPPVLL